MCGGRFVVVCVLERKKERRICVHMCMCSVCTCYIYNSIAKLQLLLLTSLVKVGQVCILRKRR